MPCKTTQLLTLTIDIFYEQPQSTFVFINSLKTRMHFKVLSRVTLRPFDKAQQQPGKGEARDGERLSIRVIIFELSRSLEYLSLLSFIVYEHVRVDFPTRDFHFSHITFYYVLIRLRQWMIRWLVEPRREERTFLPISLETFTFPQFPIDKLN